MDKKFQIEKEGQAFFFSVDEQGIVWLLDDKNGNSSFGQERPVNSLKEAKETAQLMLYAMGKIKKP